MIRLSASLIKDYLSCYRKGFYRLYHPEEAIQTHEMARGSLVHKVIEDHWNDRDAGYKALPDLYKQFNIKRDYDFIDQCLNNYYKLWSTMLKEDDLTEKFFNFNINDEIEIVGRLDRVTDGKVLDWKTSWEKPESISNDAQFILYEWAYQKMFNKDPEGLYYVHLKSGHMVKYERNESAVDILKHTIIPAIVKNIKNKNFDPTGLFGYKICDRCVFVNDCWTQLSIE
jgi:RecB family exonuclease